MGIFHAFLLSADFFKSNFFETFFQECDQSVKQFVKPDLDPNCLQKFSADDTKRQRVKGAQHDTVCLLG